MRALEWIAEQRIREAIEQGKLDNLPGAGKPIRIESDHHLPPELRVAYTVLRNAGFVPPLIELRRRAELEIEAVEAYVETCVRYAEQFCAEMRHLAQQIAAEERLSLPWSKGRVHRQKARLAEMVRAYDAFCERCRQAVQERVRGANACIRDVYNEWLRENQRRPFGHGVDLTLVPVEPGSVVNRLRARLPEIPPEVLSMIRGWSEWSEGIPESGGSER